MTFWLEKCYQSVTTWHFGVNDDNFQGTEPYPRVVFSKKIVSEYETVPGTCCFFRRRFPYPRLQLFFNKLFKMSWDLLKAPSHVEKWTTPFFAEKSEYIFIILIWKRLYFFHSEHSRSCLQNIMGKRKDRGIRTYLDVSEKDILIDVVLKGVTRLLYWKNSIILFTIKDLLMLLLGDKTIEFCVVIWIFTKTVFVHSSIYIPWWKLSDFSKNFPKISKLFVGNQKNGVKTFDVPEIEFLIKFSRKVCSIVAKFFGKKFNFCRNIAKDSV